MQQLAILLACTQSLGRWLRLLNGTMIRDYFSLHTITYTAAAPHGSPPLSVLPLQYLTQKQVKFMMVADVLLFLQHFHYYCVCIGLIISIMEFNVMANYLFSSAVYYLWVSYLPIYVSINLIAWDIWCARIGQFAAAQNVMPEKRISAFN